MSFPKSRAELRGIIFLVKALRFARPVANLLGWKLDKKLLDDTIKIGESLLMIAEEFNPVFASRGWIACNVINTEAAQAALRAAAEERWDEADRILADAYSPDLVRIHVRDLGKLRCFKNRAALAQLALDDYAAGRFHACVPVTLALLDGMGQELTGANFFRNTRRIKPKESFLEIGPGVTELLQAMSRARNATTTDSISIPFRHGILHGTDLGYNNRIVAAKAWAALLSVGQYAADYLAPPVAPQPSLLETLRRSAEIRKRIEEMNTAQNRWSARTPSQLMDLVERDEFIDGTPEGVAFAILVAWQTRKFGIISHSCCDALKSDPNVLAGKIRKTFGPGPETVKILKIEDTGSAAASVVALLTWGGSTDEVTLRMVYYKDGDVAPREAENGKWLLASLWPLESARSILVDPIEDGADI